jgi:elongation factor P
MKMVQASQLMFGMTVLVSKKPYRVENTVKVSSRGSSFIKTKLRHLYSNEVIEKNFRPNQDIEQVSVEDHSLEYLYPEGKEYIFLDLNTLDLVKVPSSVIGSAVPYLKEGVEVKGSCFGTQIFSLELPQFLELMVSAIDTDQGKEEESRIAVLETGAEVEVPLFIDVGDIIKVDTKAQEYIQRV